MHSPRAIVLTSLAMIAFAGNSLICRIALKETSIDAASFTTIRLLAGAGILWLVVRMRDDARGRGNWASAFALFAYAMGFSLAYAQLPAATGALLLFGAIQVSMIGWGLWSGERLGRIQFAGLFLAFGGVVGLMLPGVSAPSLAGSVLMLVAGIAWAVYSLRGRSAGDPTRATTGNFVRSVPIAMAASVFMLHDSSLDLVGVFYAIASGALTSGIGYALWYTALPLLRTTTAATVQLSVPVIVAAGGVAFLGEPMTVRLLVASIAILGGVALVTVQKQAHY